MYTSVLKLRYSPKLLGDRNEKWWLIGDCDPDLGRYYRHLLSIANYKAFALTKPSWKEHITVIRDEEPPDQFKVNWEKYEGEEIEFTYYPEIYNNELYYWMDVECDRLTEIRLELGLPEKPEFPYHVTIGNDLSQI